MNGGFDDEATITVGGGGGNVLVVDDVLDGGGGGMIRSMLDLIESMLDVIREFSKLSLMLLVVKLFLLICFENYKLLFFVV